MKRLVLLVLVSVLLGACDSNTPDREIVPQGSVKWNVGATKPQVFQVKTISGKTVECITVGVHDSVSCDWAGAR